VIWGGPHPTLFADQVVGEPFIDHVVMGFGAQVFGRTLQALSCGDTPAPVIDSRGVKGPTSDAAQGSDRSGTVHA
jgi:hypothetical protein